MTHAEILEKYRDQLEDPSLVDEFDCGLRFVLIERCQVGEPRFPHGRQTVWVTTHDTKRAAGHYHATQEHPEDWSIEALYDTKTGRVFKGHDEIRVSWCATA